MDLTPPPPNTNPYRYKGEYQDAATGLHKMGARYYNPQTGNWTQQDALNTIADPARANRYAAFGDDPINNSDPSGASFLGDLVDDVTESVFATAGAVIGGVIGTAVGGPGAGTAVGAVIGGAVGGCIGGSEGDYAAALIDDEDDPSIADTGKSCGRGAVAGLIQF
jgi:RHS repeat-associated protein